MSIHHGPLTDTTLLATDNESLAFMFLDLASDLFRDLFLYQIEDDGKFLVRTNDKNYEGIADIRRLASLF